MTTGIKKGNLLYDEDGGSLVQVTLTPSLIKRFFSNGEPVEHCPHREYETYITGNIVQPTTLAMDRGNYFEWHTLGKNIEGREPTKVLPQTKTGKPTAEQTRIDQQIIAFKEVIKQYEIELLEDKSNLQIKKERPIIIPELDFYVVMAPTSDILSGILYKGTRYKNTVIDLKLTANKDNTFGPFAWGNFTYMDKIQAYVNAYVFDAPFFYLVFDYPATGMGHILIKVNTIEEFGDHDHPFYPEAANRHVEMKETIRKTALTIDYYDKMGWNKEPSYNLCKDCPLNPASEGGTCDKALTSIEF